MPTCFVIQPFDSGKFDKRFEDVYKPAIEAAGLEAYRVDRDPRVDVPIDAIEDGIRAAAVCLADITTDNPNVWYELGFAFAAGRPVIMVCAEERTGKKYPFDIQHRTIISYVADAPRDFDQLRTILTTRIKALLEKGEAFRQIAEAEQVAPVEGLSQPELFVLAAVAGSATLPEWSVTIAVGMPVTRHPPHRSVRAARPHTALTLDAWRQSAHLETDAGGAGRESSVASTPEIAASSGGFSDCGGGAAAAKVG